MKERQASERTPTALHSLRAFDSFMIVFLPALHRSPAHIWTLCANGKRWAEHAEKHQKFSSKAQFRVTSRPAKVDADIFSQHSPADSPSGYQFLPFSLKLETPLNVPRDTPAVISSPMNNQIRLGSLQKRRILSAHLLGLRTFEASLSLP